MSQLFIERCDAKSTIGGGNPQDPMKGDVGEGSIVWELVGKISSVHAGDCGVVKLTSQSKNEYKQTKNETGNNT